MKMVSTYLRTWLFYPDSNRSKGIYWKASMIKGGFFTDIILAFAHIDKDDGFSIYFPNQKTNFTNLWDEVAELKRLYPHLKIRFSVGGYGTDGFSDMADDPNLCKAFVTNVCDWLEKYNLDGVDIDWEFQMGSDSAGIKTRTADGKNYITLLQNLRSAIDLLEKKNNARYYLSTAIPSGTRRNNIMKIAEIADYLNLMSYDYYGSWSETTGHHCNLYNNPADPDRGGWSTDQAFNSYMAAGVPSEKIIMGAGLYGRAFSGVSGGHGNDGLFQSYKSVPSIPPFNEGAISWVEIHKLLDKDYTNHFDNKAKASYLYNGDIWISYADTEHMKLLSDYVKQKKMGGIFVWEYFHDPECSLACVLSESFK